MSLEMPPKDLAKIDVEPLSDARWAKIESAIFKEVDQHLVLDPRVATPHFIEPPPAPRWRSSAAFVVAGAVAAAIGALVTRAVWPEPPPAITSQVETGASGTHLVIGEAALDVGPRTALVVNGDDARGVLVVLERGHVEFEVAPRRGRPSFVVQAGEARVSVTGTHFTVDRGILKDKSVHVEVASGSVEVSTPGEIVNVRAGEHWPRDNRDEISVVSPLLPPSEPSQSETPATARPARRGAASSAAAPEVEPNDFVSGRNGPASEAPEPRAATSLGSASGASGVTVPPLPSRSKEGAEALSRRALFESAARLESSHPATSLSQYGELARGSDPWAANALFAAGRLEADRGMQEAARRTLEEYLARFPRGANAADARDLLNRLKGKPKLP